MHSEESLENLLELLPTIGDIFFRNFETDNPLFDQFNLNSTHIKTLMTIHLHPNSPMNLISQKVELEKGSFTPVANKLFELGFIEKVVCENDKRKSFLRLTPQGTDFAQTLKAKHLAHISSQLTKLSQPEQELYLASLKMLITLSHKIKEE